MNNRNLIYLLGVVVILLAVIAGVLIFRPSTPGSVAVSPISPVSPAPSSNPSVSPTAPDPNAPFDPKTATKVPAGTTPQTFVENYFKAVTTGDFATAYKLLPADKQKGTTEQAFADQLKGYNFTGYKMDGSTTKGNDVVVNATGQTASGGFAYIWTFTKVGSGYVVKSRVLGGMK